MTLAVMIVSAFVGLAGFCAGYVFRALRERIRFCGCRAPMATRSAMKELHDGGDVLPMCISCRRPMYFIPPMREVIREAHGQPKVDRRPS